MIVLSESMPYSYDRNFRTAKELARKGVRYNTSFYGGDDGSWDAVTGYILGWRKEGYDWEAIPGMYRENEHRNLAIEGATEHHAGFLKALREIVREYPEVLEFVLKFDGPSIPVWKLVHAPVTEFRWASMTFFHGTSLAAWEKIQREGLRPRSDTNVAPAYGVGSSAGVGKKEAVYLTTQIQMAHFAALDAAKTQRSTPVVLEVRGLDGDLMAADEDSQETTPEKSLAKLGSVAYLGSISPSHIKPLEQMEAGKWKPVL